MNVPRCARSVSRVALILAVAVSAGVAATAFGTCGPFTDVSDVVFCPFVLEVFYLGITTGTTPTTYDPAGNVSRLQMAAFLSRSVDSVLKRGSRRAALNQFWTQKGYQYYADGIFAGNIGLPASDGEDIWAPSNNSVARLHGSSGKLLGTWTGATAAAAAIDVDGRIYITGATAPGSLYVGFANQNSSAVLSLATNLGSNPNGLTYDGSAIWTANLGGSVSMVTHSNFSPFITVSTVTAGFVSPIGILYDGANVWVTDESQGALLKLGSNGAILQTVTVGSTPLFPIYDGTNIWVPNGEDSTVSVVRASNGAVLATLTGNGLNGAWCAAFDGQRILVTNYFGDSVSLWKAASLTPLGSVSRQAGSQPKFAISDGVSFWLTETDIGNSSFSLLEPF